MTTTRSGTIAGHCLDAALAVILENEQELARLDSVAGDGGASGALVGMFITMIGSGLQGDDIDAPKLHAALTLAVNSISSMGKCQVGDKTMLDTLAPFVAAFGEAAQQGASIRAAWQQS